MAPFDPHAAASAEAASTAEIPVLIMARFRRLMNHEGHDVDLPRMCVDTNYAYGCLAMAHTSGDERLRRTALVLFDALGRQAEPTLLH